MALSPRDQRVEIRMDEAEAEALRMQAANTGVSVADIVRSQTRIYTRQRPIYPFNGTGPSFIRDTWLDQHAMKSDGDDVAGARDRLRQFQNWRKEIAPTFATVTTGTATDIVEPQYKPLVADFLEDRPLFAASTRGRISNATPFSLPGTIPKADVDGAVSEPGEGVNPADGNLTFTSVPATPSGITGLFRVTREIVDSSNPAIDVLALSVMRESSGRQSEERLFTALNAAQSGTITAGHVPSGAMVRTSTAAALPDDLRKAVAAYTDTRGRRPRNVVASSRPTVAEELSALDDSSADGSEEFWRVGNTPVFLSPRITGTAAGDGDVFVLSAGDVFSWSSPLMEFSYFEREGPGIVDVALFGYFAAAVLNPRGVASIRHT